MKEYGLVIAVGLVLLFAIAGLIFVMLHTKEKKA
jgi:hypothetical protein